MIHIDQILAFFEGLALIASPCILPILPLILSASIDGGKSRPLGIITGFISSFCFFALFSRWLVTALNLNLDTIKYISLVLLGLLGLVMVIPSLSAIFSRVTQGVADFGNRFSTDQQGGFSSGVLIGALIGYIWTPCAGPILAAVLVQVIRQQDNFDSFLTLFFFALGAGVPMLVIALMGRTLMNHLTFFKKHAESVRRCLGALILLSVFLVAMGFNFQSVSGESMNTESHHAGLIDALSNPYPAPNFVGIDAWLNSKPLTMADLKGKVVLIDFWTYSCINCVRTLPFMTALDQKYRDKGFVLIGVHAPEFEFEKNVDNIKNAIAKNNIKYPVAVDSELGTWSAFRNQYWPAQYLINQNGEIVYTHFGEGDDDIIEHNVRSLLGLTGNQQKIEAEEPAFHFNQTPETYLGQMRAERFTKTESDGSLPLHHWTLIGDWEQESEKIVSQSNDSTLLIHFNAQKVFLVMGTSSGKPIEITVLLNGKPIEKKIMVDKHTLYQLVDQNTSKEGTLEIKANAPGLELFAFTFG